MSLNSSEIRLARIMDELGLNWTRNSVGFNYVDLYGQPRKYHPDFLVEDYGVYVEFKGWTTPEMEHKMRSASVTAGIKLVVVYSDSKRYGHLGLNLDTAKARLIDALKSA